MSLSEKEKAIRRKLRDDFPHYAAKCLKIRTKEAGIKPLVLNKAQLYIHGQLEHQLREKGYVRAIILKGRQQGASTYIEGRFFWRTTHRHGCRAMILTHMQDATDNLFGMVDRYYEHCPELVRPHKGTSNAKELHFDRLDSSYRAATAGSKGAGRSETIQLLHGCLSPETPIVDGLTGSLRRMGDFEVGDWIVTHAGNLAEVSFISRQEKNALSVTLKGMRDFPLVATPEHRFWTKDGWKCLGQISKGECLGFPIRKITDDGVEWPFRLPDSIRPQGGGTRETGPDTVRPSYDLGRIAGLYLAEGHIQFQHANGNPSSVVFAVHEREVERTKEWLGKISHLFRSTTVWTRKTSKTVCVVANGKSFATFMRNLCGRVDGKELPDDWWLLGEDFVRGMVHGYLAGDGHSSKRPNDRRISATSIRSSITIGMREALAALGYGWACVNYKPAAIRHGRAEREAWILRLCGEGVDTLVGEIGWAMPPRQRKASTSIQVSNGYAWVPIVSIDDVGKQPVMDFEVDHEDHSYCTLHCATHNSESGFWPNADEHLKGALQAVPLAKGTEIILESTANGIGNAFHRAWQDAESGKSDFIPIFVPWFWQDEYRRAVPESFTLSAEEGQYKSAHGLDDEQMTWRRAKIVELRGDEMAFKQEYPATAAEAFEQSGKFSLIKPEVVMRARKARIDEGVDEPLIIGVDLGGLTSEDIVDESDGKGTDDATIVRRRGRVILSDYDRIPISNAMGMVGNLARIIDLEKPDMMFIDLGNGGHTIVDRLYELGYRKVVTGVNFGGASLRPDVYLNKRAEMWDMMRLWFEDDGGAHCPDTDEFQSDVTSVRKSSRNSHHSKLVLESKADMAKRGVRSPDVGDGAALTFSFPVARAALRRSMPRVGRRTTYNPLNHGL